MFNMHIQYHLPFTWMILYINFISSWCKIMQQLCKTAR